MLEHPPIEFVQIDPTTRCNYGCGYCRGRDMAQLDLDPAVLPQALEAFPAARFVELHGEGEPLLHPGLFDLARTASARGLRVSLFTNGSLLTGAAVDRLLDSGIEKVVVSVDSADPAHFHEARTGRLAQVIEGIERLIARRNARGLTAPAVGLSASIQRRFVDDVPGLIALTRSTGADGGLGYQPINPQPSYAHRYPAVLKAEIMPLSELDARFAAETRDLADRVAVEGTSAHRGFYDALFEPFTRGEKACPWLERGVYVTARGFVTPCCMVHEDGAYGRLGETPVASMMATRHAMRDDLARGVTPHVCAGCEVAALVTAAPAATTCAPIAAVAHDPEGDRIASLRPAVAAAEAEVAAIRASWSWRLTAPIRAACDVWTRRRRT